MSLYPGGKLIIPAAFITLFIWTSQAAGSAELFMAANRGNVDKVRSILARDPAAATESSGGGFTPLHLAAINGHAKVVDLLIKSGAHVNARNRDGATPLLKAVQGRHIDVIKLLIKRHADINVKDDSSVSPLMATLMDGNLEIAKILVESGADVRVKSAGGSTPMHMAAREDSALVKLLVKKGADVNAVDNRGWTALHAAVSAKRADIVEFLMDAGASANIRNKNDKTPLDLALEKGSVQIADLIRKNKK